MYDIHVRVRIHVSGYLSDVYYGIFRANASWRAGGGGLVGYCDLRKVFEERCTDIKREGI